MTVHADGPLIFVGYSMAFVGAMGRYAPDGSLIVVEEPDVVRKRGARPVCDATPVVGELIEWEYQLDGAADCFYQRYRDLRPSCVVPVIDYSVPFAARLAERYGVPGAGYGAGLLLRDKELLRAVTAALGIPNPQSRPASGPQDIRDLMAEVGGPVILKPANRQAALGTRIVHEPGEAEAAWTECLDQDEGIFVPDRPMPLRMLVERLVRGPEFSVEMMISKGEPVFGAATRKFLFDGPRPVEQGHLHPADIAAELADRLVADTARVLDAVGMDTGVAHCEWIVEDGVPHLVECAGRLPGGRIIELIMLAWQYDFPADYFAIMRGLPRPQIPPPVAPRAAAVWMEHGSPGLVESVEGVEEAQAVPGVYQAYPPDPGEEIGELRSSWDRHTTVIAEGATTVEALASAQQAAARIRVKVRPA